MYKNIKKFQIFEKKGFTFSTHSTLIHGNTIEYKTYKYYFMYLLQI